MKAAVKETFGGFKPRYVNTKQKRSAIEKNRRLLIRDSRSRRNADEWVYVEMSQWRHFNHQDV